MDATVSARFFRVTKPAANAPDLPDLLLSEVGKTLSVRERDVTGTGVRLRIERCEPEGEFAAFGSKRT